MAFARPFAYNLGTTIPGTEQVGNLSIGAPTSGFTNNPQFWNGPDEELGYVIAQSVSGNTQPTPLSGVTASVGFFRSTDLTEGSFITLSETIAGQSFANGDDAKTWLNNNGYWTSYESIPSPTPTSTTTPTNTQTPTSTETPTPTPSVTNTQTPTNTPTPSTSPIPVTGYSFNLIQLPYNYPASGNTIINSTPPIQTGSTNPNEFNLNQRGIFFSLIDSDGIDRTSYFSQFTGQSVTITMTQTGSTAIYSGDSQSFKYWSGNTGTPPGVPGTGFVFGTNISVPGLTAGTGNAVIIQSASTNWVSGQTVYISLVVNGAVVTPTPTATSTSTPTPSVTNTQTPTPTGTPSVGSVVNMTLLEVGGDVVLSGAGTMNTTSLGLLTPYFRGSSIVPSGAQFGCGTAGPGPFNCVVFTGGTITEPANFGTGGQTLGDSATGDFFGIGFANSTRRLFVPTGYVSGSFISGATTFNSTTLATLGATPGTYTWSWGSGANASSIIMTVGTGSVTPTPTSSNTATPTVTNTPTTTQTPTNTGTPTPTPTSGVSGNFNVSVSQVGPDVVWSGSGSFNLTSLTLNENIPGITGGFNRDFAQFIVGPTSPSAGTTYSGSSFTTFPTSFGSGSGFPPSSSSGSLFGVVQTTGPSGPREVVVPQGYVSGTVISGSMTYNTQTIAGMGLSGGTYTWAWGSGGSASSIVMTITP
jgi:hypothetical protein